MADLGGGPRARKIAATARFFSRQECGMNITYAQITVESPFQN